MGILSGMAKVFRGASTRTPRVDIGSIKGRVPTKGLDKGVADVIQESSTFVLPDITPGRGQKLADTLARSKDTVLQPLYHKTASSISPTAERMAHMLFPDPRAERGTNLFNATSTMDLYLGNIVGGDLKRLDNVSMRWAKQHNKGLVDRVLNRDQIYKDIGKQATLRMNDLEFGRAVEPNDLLDEFISIHGGMLNRGLKTLQDADNVYQKPVRGFEGVPDNPYYVPHKISATGFSNVEARLRQAGKNPKRVITGMYKESLRRGYSKEGVTTISDADLTSMARAMYSNAKNSATRSSNDLSRQIIDFDTRQAVRDNLIKEGIDQNTVDRISKLMGVDMAEKGKPSQAKFRLPLDMAIADESGIQLVDIYETNLQRLDTNYARMAAGRSALARAGIDDATKIADIKQAILTEQQFATGEFSKLKLDKQGVTPPTVLSGEDIDKIFSFFTGGVTVGRMHPAIYRAKELANLQLFQKLGLSQAVEEQANIAVLGIDNYTQAHPLLSKFRSGGMNIKVAEEFFDYLNPNFNNHIMMFMESTKLDSAGDIVAKSPIWRQIDNVLQVAKRAQSVASAYAPIRKHQTSVHFNGMSNILTKGLVKGDMELSKARLRDIGLTDAFLDRLAPEIKKHARFNERGNLDSLNFQDWNPEVRDIYIRAVVSSTDRTIQRGLGGESPLWFSDPVGGIFAHLKSFSFTALDKQLYPTLRHLDGKSIAMIAYGLPISYLAYAARVYLDDGLNPKERAFKLQPENSIHNILAYTNVFSGLVEFTDPMFTLMDMDGMRSMYRRGNFGQQGIGSLVPMYSALSSYPDSVRSLMRFAKSGEMTRGDIGNLQSASIIGRMYGVSALVGAMKPTSRRAESYYKQRKQRQEKQSQPEGIQATTENIKQVIN